MKPRSDESSRRSFVRTGKRREEETMFYPRRDLLKLALGALPAAHLLTRPHSIFAASKPNSNIGGVQIGIIAPYAFRGTARSGEEILENLVDTFGRHGPEGAKLRNVGDEQLRNAENHPGQFF